MAKIEEKMLQMVVDMAAKGGKMEAQRWQVPCHPSLLISSVSTYFFNQENLQKCHFLS